MRIDHVLQPDVDAAARFVIAQMTNDRKAVAEALCTAPLLPLLEGLAALAAVLVQDRVDGNAGDAAVWLSQVLVNRELDGLTG